MYLIKHIRVNEGTAPPFLTSTLDAGEWSDSRSDRFTPGYKATGTHWTGGWEGPRTGLDAVEARKIYFPMQGVEIQQSSS
jgi:hypothetical protein